MCIGQIQVCVCVHLCVFCWFSVVFVVHVCFVIAGAILGVALYHAPRFLCDEEKARQAENEKKALARKKALAEGKAAEVCLRAP